jgi:hypothetical protein
LIGHQILFFDSEKISSVRVKSNQFDVWVIFFPASFGCNWPGSDPEFEPASHGLGWVRGMSVDITKCGSNFTKTGRLNEAKGKNKYWLVVWNHGILGFSIQKREFHHPN